MRSGLLFTTLLAACQQAVAKPPSKGRTGVARVPGAYIVEFEGNQDPSSFYNTLDSEGTTRLKLDYQLFNGASIQLHDVDHADARILQLAEDHPAVKTYFPVEIYNVPKPKVEWIGKEEGLKAAAANKHQSRADKSLDDSDYSPHIMTQIDKLREKGITGKGTKIAVVDTGIDYTHPALGGCFGEGCLVAFGTDLVGDDYTGFNSPVPDNDPMDCNGHGTHVAGIVAAQPNKYGFTGAAPDVILGAYRVLGCEGSVANDVLIAAFNQAYQDGADIITASIGGPSGWSQDPWAVAVSRIVENGVPCTIAAGNEGAEGQMYASGAADGNHVISIASYDNTLQPTLLSVGNYTVDDGKTQEFGWQSSEVNDWDGVDLPLYAQNLDSSVADDGCDPFPDSTPDLSGKIALIRRGTCSFTIKVNNAAAAGAKYVFIYNNVAGTLEMDLTGVDPSVKGAAMVTSDQGEAWIKDLKAKKDVEVMMIGSDKAPTTFINPPNTATGGALSEFTTWGPTWQMDLKPQFGAPGGNILSTYPVAKGSYAVLSGTSMATPQAAGIVALIAQVRGTFDPETITDALAASSNPQVFNDGASFYDFMAPTQQQGAGLIQAYDAAYATTKIQPSGMSFNDTDNMPESLNFTIANHGNKHVTYSISNVPAITFYTLGDNSIYPDAFPNEPVDAPAKFDISETTVKLPKGHSATIVVKPQPPQGLDNKRLPVWSGWFAINGTDGSSYSIPYQGLAGSLRSATVLGPEDAWMTTQELAAAAIDAGGVPDPTPENHTFILPPHGKSTGKNVEIPAIETYLALGSRKVVAYVIPLTTCPPDWTYEFRGYKTIGQPVDYAFLYNTRGNDPDYWSGQLKNKKYAPPGKYKVVVFALKLYGNPDHPKDWDISETQSFRIKYAEE